MRSRWLAGACLALTIAATAIALGVPRLHADPLRAVRTRSSASMSPTAGPTDPTHLAASSDGQGGRPASRAARSQPRAAVTGAGTVSVLHVASADSDVNPRDVYVYRPGVPAGTRLPVLYLLHGVPGTPQSLADAVRPQLDAAFEAGAAPFEVAMPTGYGNASGGEQKDTEWADAADGSDLVETYLVDKVIPAVESDGVRSAAQRAIGGFSMGGYGAANIALRHPDLFGQVVSISGYFRVDDPDGMFGGDSSVIAANTPSDLVARGAGKRWLLLEDVDEDDPLIRGAAQSFGSLLSRVGANVTMSMDPGTHDFGFLDRELKQVVDFLDHAWGR
jgi:S-formylglutathione hydrolase FrmB